MGSWPVGMMQVAVAVPVMQPTLQKGFVATTQPVAPQPHDPPIQASTKNQGKNLQKLKTKQRNRKNGLEAECEKLFAEDGIAEWSELPDLVRKSVLELSCSQRGVQLLEKVFDECTTAVQVQVVEQLRGRAWEASTSRCANYVMQKCVEVLPSEHVQFIIDEMEGRAVPAAQNRFGVRVLQRLIEHCPPIRISCLVDELISNASDLCCHPFGNFILPHILEYGSEEQRHSLVTCIAESDVTSLAKHKIGNHVVSSALAACCPQDVQLLIRILAPHLDVLSKHQSGSFVAKELKHAMKQLDACNQH